ncbi:2Fe-2S ferredoxin-type domain-containing protein [Thelonectria olida]|uniref:2Fe-2S ferredoxin-type domain-containing protein n=1 Tax=Thelonectria olida TaxID=1576542 RepID=A0A9P8W9J2_9HYPO|nr:2Fe-2S ferredoxin-type domain-containing protein [Thelonectria olida]
MSASRSLSAGFSKLPAAACRWAQPVRSQSRVNFLSTRPRSSIIPRAARLAPLSQRSFTTSAQRRHGHIHTPKPGEELYITFIEKDGEEHKFAVSAGDNLLDIAQANDLEMEGACGGSCACSTCHVIVTEDDYFDKMPEPDDDENDMLDLAFGLTETSRLGCQVVMTKELDGMKVKLPSMTRNLQASDFQ